MTTMYVTYPGDASTRFDRDYYVRHHVPLVMECWGPLGLVELRRLLARRRRRRDDRHRRMPVPRRGGAARRASLARNTARDGRRRPLHRRHGLRRACQPRFETFHKSDSEP